MHLAVHKRDDGDSISRIFLLELSIQAIEAAEICKRNREIRGQQKGRIVKKAHSRGRCAGIAAVAQE